MINFFLKNNLLYFFICLLLFTSCSNNYLTSTKHDRSKNPTQTQKNKDIISSLQKEYNKASNLFFNHKYKEAIKLCDSILRKDSNFYKAYTTKGISLCFLNDFENGMKNIDKCLSLNPNFGYGRFNKALAYELYGFYDDSLKWYDKALDVEKYTWSYYGKASIYGRLGDVKNSIKYLKIALNMNPSIKECIKSEIDFNPVKNTEEFRNLIK